MLDASKAGFTEFVRARSTALLRTAVLLAGGDRGHAEDLVQGVLERMYARWDRIDGPPEAYALRALTHAAVNRWRTRRRRPELPLLTGGGGTGGDTSGRDPAATVDLRDALVRALLTLPRQRAVLVLRYLDDLPEEEVARALGCSVGTVKSQTSRGLPRGQAVPIRLELPDGQGRLVAAKGKTFGWTEDGAAHTARDAALIPDGVTDATADGTPIPPD